MSHWKWAILRYISDFKRYDRERRTFVANVAIDIPGSTSATTEIPKAPVFVGGGDLALFSSPRKRDRGRIFRTDGIDFGSGGKSAAEFGECENWKKAPLMVAATLKRSHTTSKNEPIPLLYRLNVRKTRLLTLKAEIWGVAYPPETSKLNWKRRS